MSLVLRRPTVSAGFCRRTSPETFPSSSINIRARGGCPGRVACGPAEDLEGGGAGGVYCSLPVEDGLNVAALLTRADGIGVNGLCADIDGEGVGGLLAAGGKGGVSGLFPAGADGIKPRLDNIPLLVKGVFVEAGETSLTCIGDIPGADAGIACCGILSTGGCGGTICCCIPGTGGTGEGIGPAYCSALIGIGDIEGTGVAGPAY